MTELVSDLQHRLSARAQPGKRRWWEQYLKGQAEFRGVPMGDVRKAVHAWYEDYHLGRLSDADLFVLLRRLVAQRHTEDKLAAALLLQELVLPAGRLSYQDVLREAAGYFDEGLLADWNVTDWFCVKPLWRLVERDMEPAGRGVLAWAPAENLWRARASMVTFANVAHQGDAIFPGLSAALLDAAAVLMARPERFAKTAVGWVLRGLRESQREAVDTFVGANLEEFSTEALRGVLKNATPDVMREMLARHREVV